MEQFVALCECGCGQPVRLASRTDPRFGWRRGQVKERDPELVIG